MAALDYLLMPLRRVMNAGAAMPPQPYLNIIGAGSIVDNPGNKSTDVTVGGGGPGGAVAMPRTPVTAAGITAAGLAALVASNAALGVLGAWLDVDCTGGAVAIGMPILAPNTPIFIYLFAGSPATHNVVLTAAVGATIQHQNGPTSTLQDAWTNTWTFNAAGFLGTTSVYRAMGFVGNYSVN
jgi:hypothetical protein